MTPRTTTPPPTDASLVGAVLRRVANDLGVMLGQELSFEEERVERVFERPAGPGLIHISFKLALESTGGAQKHGALLVPLPDAISMACFLLMIPDETVATLRLEAALEPAMKDALLEIGNMIGAATGMALDDLELSGWSARSEGCQGVRANVRPAFPYPPGSQLVVGRARMQLGSFEPFELILMLPTLG